VSNFNLEEFPGRREIIAGPEIVNGTGDVSLKFYDGDTLATCFIMNFDEALAFADWIAKHAFEAQRQQWREHHILSG
jgi:hypothetical protein